MILKKKIITIIISILLSLSSTFSIEHYASFSEWNVGARSLGMGRSFVGLADDVSALFWNPAGIMQVNNMQAIFQMVMLYEGYSLMYAGITLPGAESSLGLEFMMLGGAGIEGRDRYNQLTEMVSDSKMAIGAVYAKRVLQDLYFGAKAKFYTRALGDYSDMAIGGDISALYNISDKLSVGWNLTNVFGMVLGETNDKLLSSSMLGFSYKEKDLIIAVDSRENFNEWHFGLEWKLLKMLPLRFGVNNTELSLGGGVNLGMLQFDFAYVLKEIGSNIGFSCNLNFGDKLDKIHQNQIDQYLADAKKLLESDFFYLAKSRFEDVLLIDPSRKDVITIIGRIEKSLPFIDSSLELEKRSWLKFSRAKKLYNEGKITEAKNFFEEIQKIYPGNRFIIYYLDEINKKL